MKRILLVAVSLFALAGFCDEAETIKVRGKGIGTNKMEALKDAYRDAIEQAVGLYVDAEQMVKNEELVKDKILTQSNAYIEKYELVSENNVGNGLIGVKILAVVRKTALAKRIREVMNPQIIDMTGIAKNLHAQIATETKKNTDSLTLLKNELDGLSPVKQLMKVTLGTTTPIVESVSEDANLVRLWYPINVEVDKDKYYRDFAPRMNRLFEQIKVAPSKRLDLRNESKYVKEYKAYIANEFGISRKQKSGVMTRCDIKRSFDSYLCIDGVLEACGLALNEEYKASTFLATRMFGKECILCGFSDGNVVSGINYDAYTVVRRAFTEDDDNKVINRFRLIETVPEDCTFGVGIVTMAHSFTLSGRIYMMPCKYANEIVRWQHNFVFGTDGGEVDYDKMATTTAYEFVLKDASGNEVAGASCVVRNIDVLNFVALIVEIGDTFRNYEGGKGAWLITPLVGGFAKSYVKWVSVDVPKDDVAKIATASISVEE